MASSGPLIAGTGANQTGIGTVAWSNPGNITANDGSDASFTGSTAISNYLVATNFGFSIPTGATIDGIVVTIERYASQNGAIRYCWDEEVKIVKGGSIGSTNKGDTSTKWPTAAATTTYGGSTDLWGETWSPSDINASNFGVTLAAEVVGAAVTGSVDYISITVYYTESAGDVTISAGVAAVAASGRSMSVSVVVPVTISAGVAAVAASGRSMSVIVPSTSILLLAQVYYQRLRRV